MSHLTYSSYPVFGEEALKSTNYSQAVLVPSTGSQLHISGQGGWDRAFDHTHLQISADLATEIDQAFANVDATLKHAGGKGMDQVYKLVIYAAPFSQEYMQPTINALKKWFPNHKPCLTFVGVEKLGLPGMTIEVDASAHLP